MTSKMKNTSAILPWAICNEKETLIPNLTESASGKSNFTENHTCGQHTCGGTCYGTCGCPTFYNTCGCRSKDDPSEEEQSPRPRL